MQLTDEDRTWFTTVITTLISQSEARTTAQITSQIQAGEQRTAEAIEASENRLLRAFQDWASPLDTRVRAHGMAIGALEGEKSSYIEQAKKLIEIERRLEKLEKAS
jgi:hypothetical protein